MDTPGAVPTSTREQGKAQVEELVGRFRSNLAYYRSPEFDEFSTRDNFINPLLGALGWDVTDQGGLGPLRDVILEHRVVQSQTLAGDEAWDRDLSVDELVERQRAFRKYPDYAFRVSGDVQFFLEAKRPGVAVGGKVPVFQLKTYAWTSGLPVSAVSDFEELFIFDCTVRPDFQAPRAGLMLSLHFEEYVARWEDLWDLVSREAVAGGSLRRTPVAARTRQRGAVRVDNAFLDEMSTWRKDLAENLLHNNPNLGPFELAEATQRILDRLVFLRVCEDRGIETDYLLRRYARVTESYRRLAAEFRRLDVVYNGQLFAPHFSERLEVGDWMFQRLIENLYPPFSPYRFDAFGADLLGAVYERFLGKTIELDDSGVRLEDKPEVRHAGGVYYTPIWVVDYIVRAVLEPLLEGKTPRAALNLRILDPACGSGSFLLGAFDFLTKWHEAYYDAHSDESPSKHYAGRDGRRRLTLDAKSEILQRCLFGIDIDPQAVEVTQMSLYLKLLEGEEDDALRDRRLFHGALLPPLSDNIRSGNTLLGPEDVPMRLLDTFEVQRRVNPFDWADVRTGFGQVLEDRGGFDAIIGNPPYTRVQVLRRFREAEADAYAARYATAAEGSFDIAGLFIERCLPFLRDAAQASARLGFIISRQFAEADYGRPLRRMLSANRHVEEVVDFGSGLVFEGVGAYTLILVLNRRAQESYRLTRVVEAPSAVALEESQDSERFTATLPAGSLGEDGWDLLLPFETELLDRLAASNPTLGEVTGGRIFQGVVTGADNSVFRFLDRGRDSDLPSCRRVVVRGSPNTDPVLIEEALLRPVYEGRTAIQRFLAHPSEELLLMPYARTTEDARYELLSPEVLESDYPHTWEWLSGHRAVLEARSGTWSDRNWFSFSRRQNLELFEENKVLVPYMVDHLCAHWDTNRHFFVNVATGGYGIVVPDSLDPLLLTALLNSRLLSWVLRCYSRAWRGGWFAARKGNLVRLPVAAPESERAADIIEKYRDCVRLRGQLDAATSEREQDLAGRLLVTAAAAFDAAVEDCYSLSSAEREILSL